MKYIALLDTYLDIQRTEFECDDDSTARILATEHFSNEKGIYTIYSCNESVTTLVHQFIISPKKKEPTEEEIKQQIELVKSILSSHKIRICVNGCGCCGSPWITFEYKGHLILDSKDHSIDMFDDSDTR